MVEDCCPRWALSHKDGLAYARHDPQCVYEHQETWADVARHLIDQLVEWWEKQ